MDSNHLQEKSRRHTGEIEGISLDQYAELLAYMQHDRRVTLPEALSIYGISEELWHRADLHWSEELSATPSWHGLRLALDFGAAFMRTRIALRALDEAGDAETPPEAEPCGSEAAFKRDEEEEDDEDDRPTLPELRQSARPVVTPLPIGESDSTLHGEGGLP